MSAELSLERAKEILDGKWEGHPVKEACIYNKYFNQKEVKESDLALVLDQEADIQSLREALKRAFIPPEPPEPNLRAPHNFTRGFEINFKCKDRRDIAFNVYVGDGYYHVMGYSKKGENCRNLRREENDAFTENTQNRNIGKWLEAHGLRFREEAVPARDQKDDIPKMLHQKDGVFFYSLPRINGVFAEQYQLSGTLHVIDNDPKILRFLFTGDINLRISGTQLGASEGEARLLEWHVTEMPVNILQWENGEASMWGSAPLTFKQAVTAAKDYEKNNSTVKAAIRTLKMVFCESGDLLYLEGNQILFRR